MADPKVLAYVAAVQVAKRAIRAAVEAAAEVARDGLPTWQVIDLAATQLGIEVAAARTDALQRRLQLPPSEEDE